MNEEKALVLGFGGTGTHILTYLKELAVYKFGQKPDFLHFMEFDTIANWRPGETINIAGGAGAEETIAAGYESKLDERTEYFHLGDQPPGLRELAEHLMGTAQARRQYPHLDRWLNTEQLKKLMPPAALNITRGAAQQRQIGRYSMFINATQILGQLTKLLRQLAQGAGSNSVNVWLVGSAAGGTGAGCMLDAAIMVLLAARRLNIKPTMTGIIVLPDVYADKSGISQARAYSLFRELERLQALDLSTEERFMRNGEPVAAEVQYDQHGDTVAYLPSRLFDYLILLGRRCESESDRKSFFNSVASAIDPYIDRNVGASMMEKLVNKTSGQAIGFGAARLSAPLTTYAERFAWELAADYLSNLTAPQFGERQVTGVFHGSERDRQLTARGRVINLLAVFKELDAMLAAKPDDLMEVANRRMDPQDIISRWYQFASPEAAGLDIKLEALTRDVPLTYINPFLSLDAVADAVSPTQYRVKTYSENQKAKGVKESKEQSLTRFQMELRDCLDRYTDNNGGEGSFQKGRRVVLDTVAATLSTQVDKVVIAAMRDTGHVGLNPQEPDQGTPLSRLYKELQYTVSIEGPLQTLEKVLTRMVDGLEAKSSEQRQSVADALLALNSVQKPLFSIGNWADDAQVSAREACGDYVLWFQRRYLIDDMRVLVSRVRDRFQLWLDCFSSSLSALALSREASTPALVATRSEIARLDDRLGRLANDDSTFISLARLDKSGRSSAADTGMQGFVDKRLKPQATQQENRSLADIALAGTKWELSISQAGKPQMQLRWPGGTVAVEQMRFLHKALYESFRPVIDRAMADFDIFSYLLYVKDEYGIGPEDLADLLHRGAAPNLTLNGGAGGTSQFVFKAPRGSDAKRNYADSLRGALSNVADDTVHDNVANHSDPTSISVLRAVEAPMAKIDNIQRCSSDYAAVVTEVIANGAKSAEVPHALVYHNFRAEAEAWLIERHHYLYVMREKVVGINRLIPPRVVRLLENPEMMQAFVHAVVTGAIERPDPDGPWIWHNPAKPLPVELGTGDLLITAVRFVLQQRPGTSGLDMINLRDARASAIAAAEKQKTTLVAALRTFVQGKPDVIDFLCQYLTERLNEPKETQHSEQLSAEWQRLIRGLAMVFSYYLSHPDEPTLINRTL